MRPIFLAAPERGHGALSHIEALLREIQVATGGALKGSLVFVPHLHASDTDPAAYFTRSLQALQEARVVVAILDGAQVDDNVAFLLGYAFAAQKPIIGYRTDARETGTLPAGALSATAHDARALAAALAPHL